MEYLRANLTLVNLIREEDDKHICLHLLFFYIVRYAGFQRPGDKLCRRGRSLFSKTAIGFIWQDAEQVELLISK